MSDTNNDWAGMPDGLGDAFTSVLGFFLTIIVVGIPLVILWWLMKTYRWFRYTVLTLAGLYIILLTLNPLA